MTPSEAHRQVDRRDGRLEGAPDDEPDADAPEPQRAMKDAQRDLTSLSGPPPRARPAPAPRSSSRDDLPGA